MDVSGAIDHVEVALLELDYLLADAHFGFDSQTVDKQNRSVASFYRAAHRALEVSLDALNKAENLKNRALVA